jgi:hypothetical protein
MELTKAPAPYTPALLAVALFIHSGFLNFQRRSSDILDDYARCGLGGEHGYGYQRRGSNKKEQLIDGDQRSRRERQFLFGVSYCMCFYKSQVGELLELASFRG